ncbi:hypothetical protein SPRG_07780 [Saprolegnia parasitica CBS 223.65]|uniref:FYVE-type domain-containing protein n=1 Tax=Saprolegnia parasitica (strain CBS 223.65) TaxID=695850 RepID=A0A067C8H4_SAPPC|nr:hypothetical protein SPRG_07780 [Saprolegnia parasitica CBS 223.65]KDO27069.1 hypothetical protein SPRG_07780 [Saprolegnia parasitica CBS 223.65]|eukprot:XP_012202164.1 hypothetical protein SPRG_07780 [Saprolegnia parasitica CBS 223.65]
MGELPSRHDNLEDFPLPPDFFRSDPLSAIEQRYLEGLGQHNMAKLLVTLSESFLDAQAFPCVKTSRSMHLYQGLAPPSEPNIIPFRAATTVQATFRELKHLLCNVTSEQMTNAVHKYAYEVLDMAILHEIPTPTPQQRMFVRWMATECPPPLRRRDFCVLEVHYEALLGNGKRAFLISQHSIRLSSCPDLKSAYNLVRGSIYNSGTIIMETDSPGILNVRTHTQMDLKGRVPSWLHKVVVRQRVARLQSLHASLQDLRLGETLDGTYIPMVRVDARSHCGGCGKTFHTFPKWRRKHHCQLCGEVFCSKCATPLQTKGRVCYACKGTTVESSLRSPCRSADAAYAKHCLFDDFLDDDDDDSIVGANTTGHMPAYHPCTSSSKLLQLLDKPRVGELSTPDVALEALQFDWLAPGELASPHQGSSALLPMLEVDSAHVLRLIV